MNNIVWCFVIVSPPCEAEEDVGQAMFIVGPGAKAELHGVIDVSRNFLFRKATPAIESCQAGEPAGPVLEHADCVGPGSIESAPVDEPGQNPGETVAGAREDASSHRGSIGERAKDEPPGARALGKESQPPWIEELERLVIRLDSNSDLSDRDVEECRNLAKDFLKSCLRTIAEIYRRGDSPQSPFWDAVEKTARCAFRMDLQGKDMVWHDMVLDGFEREAAAGLSEHMSMAYYNNRRALGYLLEKSGDNDFSRLPQGRALRRKRQNEQRSCAWGVGSRLSTV
ncbi:MAG: hypothetical protein LLG06_19535 [Desulfobacteraceae bacterium]|nr:hypothetical protein [Desulfobacteraceae bacterium]